MIQWFGNGFGHNGSTAKRGATGPAGAVFSAGPQPESSNARQRPTTVLRFVIAPPKVERPGRPFAGATVTSYSVGVRGGSRGGGGGANGVPSASDSQRSS